MTFEIWLDKAISVLPKLVMWDQRMVFNRLREASHAFYDFYRAKGHKGYDRHREWYIELCYLIDEEERKPKRNLPAWM